MKIFPLGIELTDTEQALWESRISDIESWIYDAIKGHTAHCQSEFIKEWLPKLMADPTLPSIPKDIDSIVSIVKERPDYRSRDQKDKEQDSIKTATFQVI